MINERAELAGRRVTWLGLWANVALVALKLFGGIVGRCQALVADAIHSLSDLFSDVVVLWGLRMRVKAPDQNHHFGHGRLETMAAAMVGLILGGAASILFYDSILDLMSLPQPQPEPVALAIAAVSIVVKEALYRVTIRVGRRVKSASVQANAWHHRSDSLSSVAVFIGVGVAVIWPSVYWADAAATMAVAVMIMYAAVKVLWQALRELTDAAPSAEVMGQIRQCVLTVPGVRSCHDLKVRTSGGQILAQVHVDVPKDFTVAEGHAIAKTVEMCLRRDVDGIQQIIVHIDPV